MVLLLIFIPATGLLTPQHDALADDAIFSWAKGMGGVGYDEGGAINVDSVGNVYSTGIFEGTADLDPGVGTSNLVSAGGFDVYILKLDNSGNFVWAKSLGGASANYSTSIITDSDGNVYTTGYFNGTVDFNPGVGTSNLTSVGEYDAYISKLDSGGNFVWAKAVGGATFDDSYSIKIDSNNDVYFSGEFIGTVDFDPGVGTSNLISAGQYDAYISKLDSDGNFVWAKNISSGTESDFASYIALDSENNVYATGYFSGTADFDPGAGTSNLTSVGSGDIFISKIDSAGNFVWAKSMGGTGFDQGNSISTYSDGNIYTTGKFTGTADFDPGAGTSNLTSVGNMDIFISKIDSAGNFVWAKSMGGTGFDVAYSITIDPDDSVYTIGEFTGTVDFDPGAGTSNLISAGGVDIFISKLDSDGDFVWVKTIGDPITVLPAYYGSSIVVDDNFNVFTIGYFEGTADFDPGVGTSNLTSAGGFDIFISKLTQVFPPTTTTQAATNTSQTTITLNGNITDTGGVDPTARGFQYGLDNTYGTTVTQNTGPYTTGAFTADVTGLTCNTQYSFRSFATNTGGTGYGSEVSFTTSACPVSSSSGTTRAAIERNLSQQPTQPVVETPIPPSNPTPTNTSETPTTESGSNTSIITRTLKEGMDGEDVKELQKYLNTHGFILTNSGYGAPGNETVYFRKKTLNAVLRFQAAMNIVKDGIVGVVTRGFIK